MKKTQITVLVAILSLVLIYGVADAKVSGPCVNCHTMHFSQGGAKPALWDLTGSPRGALVANTCLGCHTTDGSDPLAAGAGGGQFPYVRSTTAGAFTDNKCLAGGFFPAVAEASDSHASMAHSLGSTASPAGYDLTWYNGTATGLSCAGTAGCHGSQTVADEMSAIKGGHHGSSTFGYRILSAYDGTTATAVVAAGASDYEEALIAAVTTEPSGAIDRAANPVANLHNVYKAGATADTISKLCANCHGDFHNAVGSSGAWTRHPTDVTLPVGWTIRSDGIVTKYDAKYNPFGFADVTVETGTKYVTCLSCHRAHGTGKYDLLRFNYNASDPATTLQSASSGNAFGCLACHNKQR